MTFDTIETSREDGNVLQLFKFTFGSVVTRLTSYNRDIVFQGSTWVSTQIAHSEPESSVGAAINEMTITLPLDNPIASQYIPNVPGRVGTIQVYRAHADDSLEELLVVFDGFIAQASFDAALVATLICRPNTGIFARKAPRFNYQSLCNNVLYDAGCKVIRESFTYAGTVISESGRDIDVASLSTKGAGWAIGGFVRMPSGGNDDSRLILAQSGDTISLLNRFAKPVLNLLVDVFAGCDHSITTCDTKFANAINYGGYAYVPTKNPFNSSLRGGN